MHEGEPLHYVVVRASYRHAYLESALRVEGERACVGCYLLQQLGSHHDP